MKSETIYITEFDEESKRYEEFAINLVNSRISKALDYLGTRGFSPANHKTLSLALDIVDKYSEVDVNVKDED